MPLRTVLWRCSAQDIEAIRQAAARSLLKAAEDHTISWLDLWGSAGSQRRPPPDRTARLLQHSERVPWQCALKLSSVDGKEPNVIEVAILEREILIYMYK